MSTIIINRRVSVLEVVAVAEGALEDAAGASVAAAEGRGRHNNP